MISDILAVAATIIGLAASLGGIPQILRILKRKSSGDISILLLSIVLLSYVIWFFYGMALMNYPLIITDAVGLIVFSITIAVTLKYHGR